MKKLIATLTLATAVALAPAQAATITVAVPTASVSIGGGTLSAVLPSLTSKDGNTFSLSLGNPVNVMGATGGVIGVIRSLTETAVVDPSLVFSMSYDNTSAVAQTLVFNFSTPYAGGPYNRATSSFQDGYTADQNNNGTVLVIPTSPFTNIDNPAIDGTPFGLITGGCNATGVAPLSSANCGNVNLNNIIVTTLANGTLSVSIDATISANTTYTFSGAVGLSNAAPEPASMGLAGAALTLLALGARRRRA